MRRTMDRLRDASWGRREVVGIAIAAAASAVLTGERQSSSAMEPILRPSPRFKFSLAAYSYRDLLLGQNATLTLFDFIDDCARFQLEGTELTSYYFPTDLTDDYLRRIKQHCFRLGLDISGTAVGNDFGLEPGPKRDEQIRLVKKWIEHAEVLGTSVIRIFAGHVPEGIKPEDAHKNMVSAIHECCEYAGKHGIHLALENHGGPTATADGLLNIVRDVHSPWFGVNLDTGNFSSDDVYRDLARVAPYALNVQVKVSVRNAQGTQQPTDFARVGQILRDANYRGYVALEFEEPGDPRHECEKYLDQLRSALSVAKS